MSVEKAHQTLAEYYSAHQGKVSDKWASYLDVYQRVLDKYRHAPVRLLEIGIQNGGSLEIWSEYFREAIAIVGCDINPACAQLRYGDQRVHVVVANANSDEGEQAIVAHAPGFEIIIDDGSHRSSDIIRSFVRYFPRLECGGVFIIEDLHCSYWEGHQGGLLDPGSSISFFKRLADVINHEHWGVPARRSEILQSFDLRYAVHLSEAELSQIHSVEFLNSVCIVTKRASAQNALGTREIVGNAAIIDRELLAGLKGSHSSPPDQSLNPFSQLPPLPEDELLGLRLAVANFEQHVALLESSNEQLLASDSSLRSALGACQVELRTQQQLVTQREQQIRAEHVQVQVLSDEVTAQAAKLLAQTQTIEQHENQIRALLESRSWRATAALRWTGRQLRRAWRKA